MRIFTLELNNDLKGISERKTYIESLISRLPSPDLVLLPEMAICSYMASQAAWKYADQCGRDTSAWAMKMAAKYRTFLGVGYLDYEKGNFFNRYMIAGEKQVYGIVTKSEGESAVFMRGWFENTVTAPFGKLAIAICYDAGRRHFYENIKDKSIGLIVFPHGSPADPKKDTEEQERNDYLCNTYADAFGVPVAYINSVGKLEYMPGKMGSMMRRAGFTMNGKSKIYSSGGNRIPCDVKEASGLDIDIIEGRRRKDIRFYGENLIKGNCIFRHFILKPDIRAGLRQYEEGLKKMQGFRFA